ncbi:uncharacterized protein LOC122859490 [Aphidius gifuensis]|uniref:uncharacterized protein LOC122859490 n=1 Tax=Aphidius gifuensis TaxID=684658 RepID=UPI001CDD7E66|nr:uncharacterized protein LOC122859490 [Aphidius gifuensis]
MIEMKFYWQSPLVVGPDHVYCLLFFYPKDSIRYSYQKLKMKASCEKKKYFDLLNSQAYPLTEETDRKLVYLFEQLPLEVNKSNNVSSNRKSGNEVSVSSCAEVEAGHAVLDNNNDDKAIVRVIVKIFLKCWGMCQVDNQIFMDR